MSAKEAENKNLFRRRGNVGRDGVEITLSGRLFQVVGPATGKALPPTVVAYVKLTRFASMPLLVTSPNGDRFPQVLIAKAAAL